jgi:hypothetical protein
VDRAAEVIGWEDLALRRSAMTVIAALQEELDGGQRQLLLRTDDYAGTAFAAAADAVLASLRSD